MVEGNIQNREAYLRKMDLDGYILCMDLSDINRLVYLLQNATNNLNQIVLRVNETSHIYAEDIQDLHNQYRKLWKSNKISSVHITHRVI